MQIKWSMQQKKSGTSDTCISKDKLRAFDWGRHAPVALIATSSDFLFFGRFDRSSVKFVPSPIASLARVIGLGLKAKF